MRAVLAVLVVAAAAFAQCPLRLTPAEACQEGFARCALYVDSNGDQRCDNPGPQPVIDPEPEPADSIAVETPDDPEPVDPGIEETPSDPEPLIEEVVETSEEETVQETGETLEEDTSAVVQEPYPLPDARWVFCRPKPAPPLLRDARSFWMKTKTAAVTIPVIPGRNRTALLQLLLCWAALSGCPPRPHARVTWPYAPTGQANPQRFSAPTRPLEAEGFTSL